MPDGSIPNTSFVFRPDQMLTFLQIGRRVNSDHFSTTYDIEKVLLSVTAMTPIGVDVTSDDSYYKFNLDYIIQGDLIQSMGRFRFEGGQMRLTISNLNYSSLPLILHGSIMQ